VNISEAEQRIFVGEYQRSRRFQFSCHTCLGFFESEGAKYKFTCNPLDLNKNIALVRTQSNEPCPSVHGFESTARPGSLRLFNHWNNGMLEKWNTGYQKWMISYF
jgi:hypothetical protein